MCALGCTRTQSRRARHGSQDGPDSLAAEGSGRRSGGFLPYRWSGIRRATAAVSAAIAGLLDTSAPAVVVRHEFMYLPLCVAEYLAREGFTVRYQTSTRSPACPSTSRGTRCGVLRVPCFEGDHSRETLYNAVVDASATDPRGSQVVFVCDRPARHRRVVLAPAAWPMCWPVPDTM